MLNSKINSLFAIIFLVSNEMEDKKKDNSLKI